MCIYYCDSEKIFDKLRVCVDYKKLNVVTKKYYYPLHFIDKILEEVASHEWYSFGDGYSFYNQMQIALEYQLKTTFTTLWRTFDFRIMSFDLYNAPSTFQSFMNLETFHWKVCEIFHRWFLCIRGKRLSFWSFDQNTLTLGESQNFTQSRKKHFWM